MIPVLKWVFKVSAVTENIAYWDYIFKTIRFYLLRFVCCVYSSNCVCVFLAGRSSIDSFRRQWYWLWQELQVGYIVSLKFHNCKFYFFVIFCAHFIHFAIFRWWYLFTVHDVSCWNYYCNIRATVSYQQLLILKKVIVFFLSEMIVNDLPKINKQVAERKVYSFKPSN